MNSLSKTLPPLTSLLPFEAAARLGSFTRAAEELHLTQAAISRQIRALEENLGIALFERRNRSVFLTQAGRELGRTVSAALDSIASQADVYRREQRTNEVVLFCQLCESIYWLMPRLVRFHQRYPHIELRISASTRPLTEASDSFDVALQTTGRASGSHSLAFTASDEVFPVCSPKYLEGWGKPPLALDNLPDHHLLHHKTEPSDWLEWDDWLTRLDQPLRVGTNGTVFDSYPLMLQAAIQGHGVALGWYHTTAELLQAGTLVRPFKEHVHLASSLSIYRRDRRRTQPAVTALLEWLREELS